jgi:cell division protein FtsB
MNVDLGIWGKLTRAVILLSLVAGLLAVGLWYAPVIKRNQRMRTVILRLDAQIQKAEQERKQLETSVEALNRDPKAVERLAREKLGYAKPGETVIRFTAPTNRPAAQ